jgi:flavodoxin
MDDALVLYDSIFGNTERVARAVAEVLGTRALRVREVEATNLAGLGLLVVGSPTRAFSPTSAVKTLLRKVPRRGLVGVRVAAFDTRMDPQRLDSGAFRLFAGIFGYAAETIAKKLRRRGGEEAARPGAFVVEASEGPLFEGELERARAWAASLLED